MSNKSTNQVYHDVINRCWEDEGFKKRFIEDPAAVLESDFKKFYKNPDGRKLVAIDQTDASVVNINIPRPSETQEMELTLTDEQLESVSGGLSPYIIGGVLLVGAGILYGHLNDRG